jgi:hypothetical protein
MTLQLAQAGPDDHRALDRATTPCLRMGCVPFGRLQWHAAVSLGMNEPIRSPLGYELIHHVIAPTSNF